MYRALADGDVDVISAFSSDGRIEADRLTVLEDPQRRIPPYDAIVMISPARANDGDLLATLQPLVGTIPVRRMRQANFRSEEHTSELQSLMRISYAVFCLKKKTET